ncbi:phage head closure protein [Sphingopyxis indica]|uniref:phage head closure protein n=1 Tax=Sphingopyxis indica TaxID=436663 RepID=UPI0029392063|nr:phage head closure protein [Sphingopyxis indica]WOF43774.1 phage head closure protein [Sphingopyxis indica]
MRLGRLNRRITILRKSNPSRDALNEEVVEWTEFATFWAEELQQRPTESWKAGQTAAQVEKVWRIRWGARAKTILPTERVRCGGLTYEIIGVTEPVRRTIIQIVAIAYSEGGIAP